MITLVNHQEMSIGYLLDDLSYDSVYKYWTYNSFYIESITISDVKFEILNGSYVINYEKFLSDYGNESFYFIPYWSFDGDGTYTNGYVIEKSNVDSGLYFTVVFHTHETSSDTYFLDRYLKDEIDTLICNGTDLACSSMTYFLTRTFSHYFEYDATLNIDGDWVDVHYVVPKYFYHINICKGSTLYYTTSVDESDYNDTFAQSYLQDYIDDCEAGLKIKTDCCILVCCEPDKYELN